MLLPVLEPPEWMVSTAEEYIDNLAWDRPWRTFGYEVEPFPKIDTFCPCIAIRNNQFIRKSNGGLVLLTRDLPEFTLKMFLVMVWSFWLGQCPECKTIYHQKYKTTT